MRLGIKDNFAELQGFTSCGELRCSAAARRHKQGLQSLLIRNQRNSSWHFIGISLTIDQEEFQK
jgi:hypothetical protein